MMQHQRRRQRQHQTIFVHRPHTTTSRRVRIDALRLHVGRVADALGCEHLDPSSD